MSRKQRSTLGAGLLLILLGAWFIVVQFIPTLDDWFWQYFDWPMVIIAVGVFLLVFGLLLGAPGMAVPAVIVSGIGGLLAYQNATGNWESWSYAWALIPGFVGLGIILAALLGEGGKSGLRDGLNMLLFSAVLFAIFASIFGVTPFGPWWPVLIIAWGLWLLIRALFGLRKS